MARLTNKQKELIIADFHTGAFTTRALADKYEISHVSVYNLIKGLKPKHKEKVRKLVQIKTELASENPQEVKAVNEVVDEKTKHLIFFQTRALANQKKADELLEFAEDLNDVDAHSRITARNKETVLGKAPETIINNANLQQTEETKIVIERRNLIDVDKS